MSKKGSECYGKEEGEGREERRGNFGDRVNEEGGRIWGVQEDVSLIFFLHFFLLT